MEFKGREYWLGLLGTRKLSETEGSLHLLGSNLWFSLYSFSFYNILQHATAFALFSFLSVFELLLGTH